MNSLDPAATSLLILAAAIGLFVWSRLSVGVVAVGVALSLAATGVLTAEQAIAGFGDPVLVFIAALFVVSEGIDATGVTTWVGQQVSARAGTERRRLLVTVMVLCAVAAALVTPNGAVAALLPVAVVLGLRASLPPSMLLLPLAFAAHAGSLLMLTGSPVNVIVSDAAVEAGKSPFAFFEYAVVGLPLLAVTVLITVVLGPRLLPARASRTLPADLARHAATLREHYDLRDGFYRLRVEAGSPLVGTRPGEVDLSGYPGLSLVGLQAGTTTPAPVRERLDPGDVLVVTGSADAVSRLVMDLALSVTMTPVDALSGDLIGKEMGVVEVVVPPRSPLVGETVFPGMRRSSGLVIMAVQRLGRDTGAAPIELTEGDSILLHGTWPAIDELIDHRDVLLVDSPDLVRRQAVTLGKGAVSAIVILVLMVVALATGAVIPAVAALTAATAMVAFRVITSAQAYRAVSWQTIVLIGALIPLSTAIQDSGAADLVSDALISVVGTSSPLLLLAALFALTGALGQIISNTATVLIVAPIAVTAAAESGIAAAPVLMLIAVAGASSFLTPIATPANMMVMSPAGYRFGDYWKLGLPIMVAWLAVALVVIPLRWPL
jgi:di/tricarboxylate transporter